MTPDQHPPPGIGALLRAAHEIVSRCVYERTAASGHAELHPAHFRLLQYPGLDGVRPTELAARVTSTKQAINPLLNDLEAWGYITRESDPDDRRGRIIRLTSRGQKLMRTIREAHRDVETEWTDTLGAVGFLRLREMLSQLTNTPRSKHAAG